MENIISVLMSPLKCNLSRENRRPTSDLEITLVSYLGNWVTWDGVRGHGGDQVPQYLDFRVPLSVSVRPPGTPNSLPSHTPLPGAASSVGNALSCASSATAP